MRKIPDTMQIEYNGHVFLVGTTLEAMRYRHDPVTIGLIAAGAGTAMQVSSTLKQGKQAEELAEQQAQVDLQNADQVRKQAVEAARIEAEEGREALEAATAQAGASGIRVNVGSPLVIQTKIRNDLAKDTGFILERGRAQEMSFRDSAALNIAQGKQIRQQSKTKALTQGLFGAASIAFMGADAGIFSSKSVPISASLDPFQFTDIGRTVRSGVSGGGRLNKGPTSLFDLNAGGGSGRSLA